MLLMEKALDTISQCPASAEWVDVAGPSRWTLPGLAVSLPVRQNRRD
jgi:hypothetical protein